MIWGVIWRRVALAAFALLVGISSPASANPSEKRVCPEKEEWKETPEGCPCKVGWRPTKQQIADMLRAHEAWLKQGGRHDRSIPGQALLCNAHLPTAKLDGANLSAARLDGANLRFARLEAANLNGANLSGADLASARLKRARLFLTNFENADLGGADLEGALMESTIVTNARFAFASLKKARYAPASPPPNGHVERIEGLATVVLPPGKQSGLVQLRELVRRAGLRDLEREATFAIEHNRAEHARRLGPLSEKLGGWLKLVFFEWTTGWGLYPERALTILVVLAVVLSAIYLVAIVRGVSQANATHGIYRIWPSDRLEPGMEPTGLAQGARAERLVAGLLPAVAWALYFSTLSAFHFGWRDFNVGTWLTRMQFTEFALRGRGWVRFVSGFQSLASLYLLALWGLTYFGRPFQ